MNKLIITPKTKVYELLEAGAAGQSGMPSWMKEENIVKRLDARPIIEQGGHPLGEVLTGVSELKNGEIYELITPFLPAPLIERIIAQGFDSWSEKKSEDYFRNYFLKKD